MSIPIGPDLFYALLVVAIPKSRIEIDAAFFERLEFEKVTVSGANPRTPAVEQDFGGADEKVRWADDVIRGLEESIDHST